MASIGHRAARDGTGSSPVRAEPAEPDANGFTLAPNMVAIATIPQQRAAEVAVFKREGVVSSFPISIGTVRTQRALELLVWWSVGLSTKMKFRTGTVFLSPPALTVDGGKCHN